MTQTIITAVNDYQALDRWIGEKKVFLVCDSSLQFLHGIKQHLDALEKGGTRIVHFSDFQPNPLLESVVKGVQVFQAEG